MFPIMCQATAATAITPIMNDPSPRSLLHCPGDDGCKYDSLELMEGSENEDASTQAQVSKRFCGDWNSRLKLLRYASITPSLTFRFESDYSHSGNGFKANIWSQKVTPQLTYAEEVTQQCQDEGMEAYRNNCYLVVSSPVNFETAQHLCQSLKGSLTSIVTVDEWRFITQMLVSKVDYNKKSVYWLGGYIDKQNQLAWKDRMPFNYSAFHPSDLQSISEWKCLSLYWHEGGKGTFAWKLSNCKQLSGYICKKPTTVESRLGLNRTLVGIGGKLSTPKFPSKYSNDLDYTIGLSAPAGTVIVIQFSHVDIEFQDDCLYDYVLLMDKRSKNSSRVCGSTFTEKDLTRFDFVSVSNTVDVMFHSDFADNANGFELTWRAVDVSECLSGKTILTGLGSSILNQEGSFHSPNFPYFNLPSLNCVYTIVAPAGHRIWLKFDIFEVGEEPWRRSLEVESNSIVAQTECAEDHVIIDVLLGEPSESIGSTVMLCGNLTAFPHRTTFVSSRERIQIHLVSQQGRRGRGFVGKFKTLPAATRIKEQVETHVEPNASFVLTSLNFPFEPPSHVSFTTVLNSQPNYILTLEIRGDTSVNCQWKANSFLIIHDSYVGTNGTSWTVCNPSEFSIEDQTTHGVSDSFDAIVPTVSTDLVKFTSVNTLSRTSFHSMFNRLEITEWYKSQGPRRKWNAVVITTLDENFRAKVLAGGDRLLLLNACVPNPCLNSGKCVTDGNKHICRCPMPYTGPFCGLSVCDLNPCLFGDCVVEQTSFRCYCHVGYAGDKCDRRAKPCMKDGKEDKCTGHGECVEVNDSSYKCLCYEFWEGPRCDSRMQNIPFRPLSERMLREPFWLGIITVTVVLGVIGLVWCLKRHFPEKLEKFLNDDLDRNRRISWGGGCSYHGVRDPNASTSSQQATSPQAVRSLLGRFGIRKPSLLSLSSATSISVPTTSPHTYENRTFSLDDLLRPSRSSMMRTPSPHRRRNFSIHSRRDPLEKQQILQQLVSSGASVSLDGTESKPSTPKPTIAEIIQMSEKRLRLASLSAAQSMQSVPSTSFSLGMDKASVETSFSTLPTPSPMSAASKAEKKVTFARLMDKLTAHDMSSSSSCSDLSCAEEVARTIMVNPKPAKKDKKGRLKRSKAYARGTCRNSETDQDGFEMSSSDTTPDPICPPRFPSRACVSPTGLSVSANNSPSFKSSGKSLPKMASADSLLALFRRFSGSSSAPPSPQYSENEESSAGGATPLSTPSSPRNSALSLNIRPPAFLITTPDTTVDASTSPGHDPTGVGQGSWRSQAQSMISLDVPMREHCLSPIHEVPTPLPTPSHSPAHSPMMHRPKDESSAHAQGLPMITLQVSSEAEDEYCEGDQEKGNGSPMVIPKIAISQEDDDCMILLAETGSPNWVGSSRAETIPDVLINAQTDCSRSRFTFDVDDVAQNQRRNKGRPPPLVLANEMMSETKGRSRPDDGEPIGDRYPMVVPVVQVQDPTPVGTPAQDEPPIYKTVTSVPPDITTFAVTVSPTPWDIHVVQQAQAQGPLLPPMIILNENLELESDSDTTTRNKVAGKANFAFLTPFVARSDRVPSESNLSTSGYSSMASPCPSRCPSVSPLCPDMDEYHATGQHHPVRRSSLVIPASSRKSSLTSAPRRCSLTAMPPLMSLGLYSGAQSRLDESKELLTLLTEVDSPPVVDTGGKPDKKAEFLKEFVSFTNLLQVPRKNLPKSQSLDMDIAEQDGTHQNMNQPPVQFRKPQPIRKGKSLDSKIQTAFKLSSVSHKSARRGGLEESRRLSPVSSRSDSSMSELSVLGLPGGFVSPITDSDGVYDCGSSEVQSGTNLKKVYAHTLFLSPSQQSRRSGRRKNRRRMSSTVGKKLSPTSQFLPAVDLNVKSQGQDCLLQPLVLSPSSKKSPTSSSPKRRVRAQINLDVTSSSSESPNSLRSSRSWLTSPKSDKVVVEEISSIDSNKSILPPLEVVEDGKQPLSSSSVVGIDRNLTQVPHSRHRNISRSRVRTISVQIRFLRRLERSLLKKRERLNWNRKQGSKEDQDIVENSSSSCSTCSSTCSTSFCSSSSSSSSSTEPEDCERSC